MRSGRQVEPRRRQGGRYATRIGLAALVIAGIVLAAAGAQPAQAPRPDTAFGFEPSELRRYQIGPPAALAPGETAEWTLRFDGFEVADGETLTVFSFTHQRFERIPGTFGNVVQLLSVLVEGSLKTNLAGFPLQVQYTQRFIEQGEEMDSTGRRFVRFWFDRQDKRFVKAVRVGTSEWEFKVAIPKQKHIDLAIPRGLYMYMPGALECLGETRVICVELEPALANPGFLSLALPALEELEEAKREFVFLMPVSLAASPFRRVIAGPWLSRERNRLANIQRYYEFIDLELEASERIEVGPRTLHAWKLDMCCGIDQVWVEPGGRVLRVDLDTTILNPNDRFIRFVFPFEEFVSPNEDPQLKCCRRP